MNDNQINQIKLITAIIGLFVALIPAMQGLFRFVWGFSAGRRNCPKKMLMWNFL